MSAAMEGQSKRRRLAIVGGGSSGLIALKYALEFLPDWEVICFEQSSRTIGCWGHPYAGFVSTSTKYTTQFSCFPQFDASVQPDDGAGRAEFFRDDQYGQYLEKFAKEFGLHAHIEMRTRVESICRGSDDTGWELRVTRQPAEHPETTTEHFDNVIVCSGLAAQPQPLACDVPFLTIKELHDPQGIAHIQHRRIIVIGGGESAVDYANRLADPTLKNEVFLSLRSGIRVSPRYHPIRGVPSDFLRNRLLLSIHPDLRNWIGQRFVEARIRYQETFEWLFPNRRIKDGPAADRARDALRKEWAYKLTKAAKDDLFNMFHNKSDDFLTAVAEGRITIVGAPIDHSFQAFQQFASEKTIEVAPDLVVPAVGYRSTLPELFVEEVRLQDFYLGCCHATYPDLHLVGFARPVIGNIPSISEIQARYVVGLIAGKHARPANIEELHRVALAAREARFHTLKNDIIYPVEMFPYCDHLAQLMQAYPGPRSLASLAHWWRMQLTPATTMHYECYDPKHVPACRSAPVYMPLSLIALLMALKPLSWFYSACCFLTGRAR